MNGSIIGLRMTEFEGEEYNIRLEYSIMVMIEDLKSYNDTYNSLL